MSIEDPVGQPHTPEPVEPTVAEANPEHEDSMSPDAKRRSAADRLLSAVYAVMHEDMPDTDEYTMVMYITGDLSPEATAKVEDEISRFPELKEMAESMRSAIEETKAKANQVYSNGLTEKDLQVKIAMAANDKDKHTLLAFKDMPDLPAWGHRAIDRYLGELSEHPAES